MTSPYITEHAAKLNIVHEPQLADKFPWEEHAIYEPAPLPARRDGRTLWLCGLLVALAVVTGVLLALSH